jgi:hypothetical protein
MDGGYITRVLRAGTWGAVVRQANGVESALSHGKWEGPIEGVF